MLTRYVSRKRGEGGQEEQNRTEIMLKHQINKLTHNDSSSGALLACLSVNAKQFFSLWPAFVQIWIATQKPPLRAVHPDGRVFQLTGAQPCWKHSHFKVNTNIYFLLHKPGVHDLIFYYSKYTFLNVHLFILLFLYATSAQGSLKHNAKQ